MTRRPAAGAALLLGFVLFAAACSSTGGPADGGEQRPSKAAASSPTPTPTPRPVTIAFGGDVHFEGQLANRLAANPRTAMGPIASALRRADLAMVNLETAVGTRGDPAPKDFTFQAPSSAFRALKGAGVDVASMANNHGMDFGEQGLTDSLTAAKRQDFPVVGIGENAQQAYAPHLVTVNNQRIAIVGATQVLDDHLITAWTAGEDKPGLASAKKVPRLVKAVRAAGSKADTVVVFLHWGQELQSCPLPRQRSLADRLIEAGADVIVGGHAHVLQAGGFLRGRYVHYGLGNFVFYSGSGETAQSGVLTLTVAGGKVTRAKWKPAVLSGGIPLALERAEAKAARAEWTSLRGCAALAEKP
ncbi:MAG: CapA family protein [Streptosporangiales bacterium]|nr:CapA family protein [Streptosporangiales bacterium]